jgi:hypothetical protein
MRVVFEKATLGVITPPLTGILSFSRNKIKAQFVTIFAVPS